MTQTTLLENTNFFRKDVNRKLDPKTRSVLCQFMTQTKIPNPLNYLLTFF